MLNVRSIGVIVLAAVALSTASVAARDGSFIRSGQIDARVLLPAPPADGSAEQRAELVVLHRIERERTPDQIAAAKADDAEEDMFVYRNVLGPAFTSNDLPLTAALSRHLESNEPVVVNVGKDAFARKRPFIADTTLHNICAGDSFSYPSGHTTNGYLQGLVLAAMVPEYRDAILARAADYANNRLVCGVHYPSDLAASKLLAYAMIGLILDNPAFEAEFAPAQAELRHALKLKPLP